MKATNNFALSLFQAQISQVRGADVRSREALNKARGIMSVMTDSVRTIAGAAFKAAELTAAGGAR